MVRELPAWRVVLELSSPIPASLPALFCSCLSLELEGYASYGQWAGGEELESSPEQGHLTAHHLGPSLPLPALLCSCLPLELGGSAGL